MDENKFEQVEVKAAGFWERSAKWVAAHPKTVMVVVGIVVLFWVL